MMINIDVQFRNPSLDKYSLVSGSRMVTPNTSYGFNFGGIIGAGIGGTFCPLPQYFLKEAIIIILYYR